MDQILKLVEENQLWVLIGLVLFSLLLLVLSLVQSIKIGKWKKKYYKMMGGKNHQVIENLLLEHNENLAQALGNLEEILESQRKLDEKLVDCVQKMGVVRYNAFNDMGSDLSYSIAMLDEKNNGVIMSGIYGRDYCNTYAKPITNGESDYKLTAEEILAIDRAKKNTIYA
ncbi:DUF4446 family protein [Irregularibacter muris]|uniref:DUF4446 family protein n=1 Tax=Irregularibacter muris TaxID=1796619 RepID=A0AAE3HEW6_9FIRM|nr:DUF4446 family protein [Irregularibacter muris]MCR1899260.1 DUF4446 family protein [Irregularibacter muris]